MRWPLLLLTLATSVAHAEDDAKDDVSVSFTTDTEVRWLQYDYRPLILKDGPKPTFIEQVSRLTARVRKGRFGFDMQFDEVAFIGVPHTVDGEAVSKPPKMVYGCGLDRCISNQISDSVYINPEKVALDYTRPELAVTLGDFYGAFGYGLALNINRNVDIDVDTSIQGGRVVMRPGDWEIIALAGTFNRQQVFQDLTNFQALRGDQRHLVAGVRAERFGIGPASIGAHATVFDYVDDFGLKGTRQEIGTVPDAVVGGATLSLFGVGGVDWLFEADGYSFPTERMFTPAENQTPGYGLYGSATFGVGAGTVQIEAKRYKNVYRLNNPVAEEIYVIVAPPTLEYERAINPDTAAVTSSNDISGVLARYDVMIGDAVPYVAVGIARDADLYSATQKAPAPETILQAQSGLELLLEDVSILANAVGRLDIRDGDFMSDKQIYGDLDVKFPLPAGMHAQSVVLGQYFVSGEHADGYVPDPWGQLSVSLSVLPKPTYGVTIFTDYNDNPIADGGGNLWGPKGYGALELFVKPARAWTLKAFHGGYAAGIRCSGGQCRTVPAFTGTRLAVTGAF